MPRLPQAENSVKTNVVLPSARLSAGASSVSFGAKEARQNSQIGQALTQVGLSLLARQEREKKKQDDNEVRERLNQAQTMFREYMNGEKGVYSQKGKNASGVYESSKDHFTMQKDEFAKDLNSEQIRMFDSNYDTMANSNLSRSLVHQTNQNEVYRQETLDASNYNYTQDALAKIGPQMGDMEYKQIAGSLEMVRLNTANKYAHLGTEVVEQQTEQATTSFHSQIINSLRTDNAAKAQEYLKDHESQMEKRQSDKIKVSLDKQFAAEKQEAQEDIIRGDSLKIFSDGGTMRQMRDKVNAQYKDSDEAEFAWSVIKTENSITAAAQKQANNDLKDAAWDKLAETPLRGNIPAEVTGKDRIAMQDYVERRAKAAAEGSDDINTDWGEFTNLNTMAMKSPEQFVGLNMYEYRGKLGDTEYKSMLSLQRSLSGKEGNGGKEKGLKEVEFRRVFDSHFKNVHKGNAGKYWSTYFGIRETVKDMTPEAAAKVMSDVAAQEVINKNWIFGKTDKVAERLTTEQGRTDFLANRESEAQAAKINAVEAEKKAVQSTTKAKMDTARQSYIDKGQLPTTAYWDVEFNAYVEKLPRTDVQFGEGNDANAFEYRVYGKKDGKFGIIRRAKDKMYWERKNADKVEEEFQGPFGN